MVYTMSAPSHRHTMKSPLTRLRLYHWMSSVFCLIGMPGQAYPLDRDPSPTPARVTAHAIAEGKILAAGETVHETPVSNLH